jgi:hypothetical protein
MVAYLPDVGGNTEAMKPFVFQQVNSNNFAVHPKITSSKDGTSSVVVTSGSSSGVKSSTPTAAPAVQVYQRGPNIATVTVNSGSPLVNNLSWDATPPTTKVVSSISKASKSSSTSSSKSKSKEAPPAVKVRYHWTILFLFSALALNCIKNH